jgi:hypothetical protein
MVLITTTFSKPASPRTRASHTFAMPPLASLPRISYFSPSEGPIVVDVR